MRAVNDNYTDLETLAGIQLAKIQKNKQQRMLNFLITASHVMEAMVRELNEIERMP